MKEKILDSVGEYSAQELVSYIIKGIVTFEELVHETDGELAAAKRREIEDILKNGDDKDWGEVCAKRTKEAAIQYLNTYPNGKHRREARDLIAEIEEEEATKSSVSMINAAWANVDKTDLNDLRVFVRNYPDSPYIKEANKIINTLALEEIMGVDTETLVSRIRQIQTDPSLTTAQKEFNIINIIKQFISSSRISKDDFLAKIEEDYNILSAGVVKKLIEDDVISITDLMEIGIDRQFIQKMLKGDPFQSFSAPQKLDRIHKQSTEVYFWGIPSSGKSCALGAILSVAASGSIAKSMDPDTGSQGYGYMTKLINLFQKGQVGTLMEGTSVDSFYEMGFDLVDKDRKIHPITCIDMAGELMRCMYKANAGDHMDDLQMEMLDTLTKVLIDNRSVNRKIHIFVIEYGAEDRLYEGLPQTTYLAGTLSYIKNTGIFKKDTDAIYIMITKADKAKNPSQETFSNYIKEKYLGFYNGLEQICINNEINRGKVEKIAFSLGEVCFQNYCKFNAEPAENVVDLLLNRSASYRGGKRGLFEKIFRG